MHSAQVAAAMHPAHQQGALAGIGGAQFSAGVRAPKFAQKVELYCFHVYLRINRLQLHLLARRFVCSPEVMFFS